MKYQLGDFTVKYWNSWDRVPRSPVQIGFAILGQLGIMASTTVALFVGLATVAAVSWIAKALMPKFDEDAFGTSSGLMTNTRNATAPQEIVYGTIRKGGIITYLESTGSTNEFLHQIICFAGHEVNSIGQIYINDQAIPNSDIDGNGNVTNSNWVDADGNSTILIKKFTGSPTQNVYTTLSNLSDGNTPNWANGGLNDDTNFRGQGIACLYVRLKYDQDVFSQGVPLFTALIEGKKVFDPRNSTTAFSANAALCIRDYLVSAYGLNNPTAINDTVFSSAANTCDESVALSGSGNEARYQINGVLSLDRQPKDILGDMVAACAGTLFWGQGKWQLVVGEYISPVKTLTLSDFRSDITISTKHSRRDNFNIVRGMFNDINADYIRSDYPEIKSSTFIADDAGVENALDFGLPLTTSSSMAQRLAKLTLFRSREQMTMTADFSLTALEIQVGDIVGITNPRYGFSAKDFEVIGWKLRNDRDGGELKVALTLRETSSSAFSWSAEEAELKANDSNLPSPHTNLTISSLTTTGGGRTTTDGTFVNTVKVSWTAPSNAFISHYEVEHKATVDSDYAATTTVENSIELSPIVDGQQYQIRVRAVTIQGVRGPYVNTTFTGGGDTTAPSPITNLTATGGFESVILDWTAPSTEVGGATLYDLKGYYIYRSTSNSQPSNPIAFVLADRYVDGGLAETTSYYYWITAADLTDNRSTAVASGSVTTKTNAGSAGADGADGADGAAGDTVITGQVYYNTVQPNSPSTPSATSFNTSTASFTGLTSGWSLSQPAIEITDTGNYEWRSTFTVTIDGDTTAQSIVFTTPVSAIQVTQNLESDNYNGGGSVGNEGTLGWHINRSTGYAEFGSASIRGTLTAGQIPDLSGTYATGTIPTNVSELTNDTGFITTSALGGYATTTALNAKNSVHVGNSAPAGTPVHGDLWYYPPYFRYYYWNTNVSPAAWTAVGIVADSITTTYLAAIEISASRITTDSLDIERLPGLVNMASQAYSFTINDASSISNSSNRTTLSGTTSGNKILVMGTMSVFYGTVSLAISNSVFGASTSIPTSGGITAQSGASATYTTFGAGTASGTSVSYGMGIIPGGSSSTNRTYTITITILEFEK
tara:strand:- start:12152 stop:15484 length:3333 start_codon:yes stop_codon:yes gene_type:complete